MKTMIGILIAVILLLVFTSDGLFVTNTHNNPINTNVDDGVDRSVIYRSFDDALLLSTDVVIANFVKQRPFGVSLIELEFRVVDRILGNAADIIYIYLSQNEVSIISGVGEASYNQGNLAFGTEVNYILVLRRLEGATLKTHEDGYIIIADIAINIDDPTLSTMYNEPLSRHSKELDFSSRSLSKDQIVTFIKEATINNQLAREHIRSDKIEDIINGSPFVFVVEIDEPRRLMNQQATHDWMETDIYYCTVVKALKGDFGIENAIAVIFYANTVKKGEQHIIAIEPLEKGSTTFLFTSKNSLFRMEQLEEIMAIIG